MTLMEAIVNRRSHRKYIKELEVEEDIYAKLVEECAAASQASGPFHTPIKIRIQNKIKPKTWWPVGQNATTWVVGTYAMDAPIPEHLKGVPVKFSEKMLAGEAEQNPTGAIDFGYAFERVILAATRYDLGTVWLAGTMNRAEWAEMLQQEKNEFVCCCSPVGYLSQKGFITGLFSSEKIEKHPVNCIPPRARNPWDKMFFDGKWGTPITVEQAGQYAQCLENVKIAPSASNVQTWRIVRSNGAFHFFLGISSRFCACIDMGIAMYHFEETAKSVFGENPGKWAFEVPELEKMEIPKDVHFVATWIPK